MNSSKKLVSLCTDFGHQDYRLALLKVEILKYNNLINLIDITHEIPTFDLVDAAFHISNAIVSFPPQQIHVIWVLNASDDQGILLAIINDQYLIMPNNGLLGLISTEESIEKVYRISDDAIDYKERIAKTIQHIIHEDNLDNIFSELIDPIKKINVQPVYQKDRIQARVLNVDRYGNLILNILLNPFKEACQGRQFSFSTQNHQVISNFLLDEVNLENGSFYVYFTEAGYMVLALCGSQATRILDIQKGDSLFIVFE